MSTTASPFQELSAATEQGRARTLRLGEGETSTAGSAGSLASVVPGHEATVSVVALEKDLAAWLAAVGIRAGERLTVLRRAIFGGPIHVRTHAGGEFALARSLARAIHVDDARPASP